MAKIVARVRAFAAVAAFGLSMGAFATAGAATPFQVPMDQARPLTLKAPASGVVIGNPSIVGVTLQSDKLLFITGKAYGTTNLIIVGESGRPIFEGLVTVTGDEEAAVGVVNVTRGLTTVRQSCNPVCRKTPDIADDPEAFTEANSQVTTYAARAKSANSR